MINVHFLAYPYKSDDSDVSIFPPCLIPYGDYFLESFYYEGYDYYKTNTGFFKKGFNSKSIIEITKQNYDEIHDSYMCFSPSLVYETFNNAFSRFNKDVPQAGLTRGSKRSFSDDYTPSFSDFEKINSIHKKYKDGIK